MPYDPDISVHTTLADFYDFTEKLADSPRRRVSSRIVHCVNPFPATPGSEHDRAQRVTFASMDRARRVAKILCPEVEIVFAKVTMENDDVVSSVDFELSARLSRTVLDLKDFKTPRPLPVMMDVLMAIDISPQDIFIFTNVDIALTSEFYAFINDLFNRSTDCAIINRRTISSAYQEDHDISLMASEAGAPHSGFDCFAFRGHLRSGLVHYDGCVGISGVMLPLLHQLLATARLPVVLTDAHVTFHLGDDQQWRDVKFEDYAEHNRNEVDKVFKGILDDPERRERFLSRVRGASQTLILPKRLRSLAGVSRKGRPLKNGALIDGMVSKLRSALRF